MELPADVENALHPLSGELALAGARVVAVKQSASFGDFAVSFTSADRTFDLVRERGQFLIHGPDQRLLEIAGLWRTFGSVDELRTPLLSWVRRENVA